MTPAGQLATEPQVVGDVGALGRALAVWVGPHEGRAIVVKGLLKTGRMTPEQLNGAGIQGWLQSLADAIGAAQNQHKETIA